MNWKSNVFQPVHARETNYWPSFQLSTHSFLYRTRALMARLDVRWGTLDWGCSLVGRVCSDPRTALIKCDVCSLGYRVSWRPGWGIQDHTSKKKKKKVSQKIPKSHKHFLGEKWYEYQLLMVQLMNFHFYVCFEVIYIQQTLHYEFCSFPRLWIQKKSLCFSFEYGSQQSISSRFCYKIGFALDDFVHLQVNVSVPRKVKAG